MNFSKKNHNLSAPAFLAGRFSMKHHKTNRNSVSNKLITIVVLAIIIISCNDGKKSKINEGNKIDQTQSDSFLSAKINGKDFYTDAPIYFSSQNIITLAAVSKDKIEKIRIYIEYKKGPATYTFGKDIDNTENMIYTKNDENWVASKVSGEGTITFTEEGGYLKASFSFTGISKDNKSTKQISNGEFKVKIHS